MMRSSFATAKKAALALAIPAAAMLLTPACSETTPAIARVILDSSIRPGQNGSEKCQISSREWVVVGNFGGVGTAPRAVDDAAAEGSGRVSVSCAVLSEGDAFRVSATVNLTGADGGTVTINGLFNTARQPQNNISVVFNRQDFGRFEQKDCVATYDVNPNATVASGRVWAKVVCPTAVREGGRACETEAQFRFENCEQTVTTAE